MLFVIPRSVFDEPETIFAIPNAKMVEAGQEVLNERSEFRNLRHDIVPFHFRLFL